MSKRKRGCNFYLYVDGDKMLLYFPDQEKRALELSAVRVLMALQPSHLIFLFVCILNRMGDRMEPYNTLHSWTIPQRAHCFCISIFLSVLLH